MAVEHGCGGMWGGTPGRRPAVIMGMVVVGTMTGTAYDIGTPRRSEMSSVRPNDDADLTFG
jgi:hypothetical protein